MNGKPRKLGLVLMSLLLAVVIAANVACSMYANIITQFFSRVDTDEDAVSAAKTVSLSVIEEVESEGIVLLKNENSALPLDTPQNLNVFGWSSIDPIYGGNGSGAADESGNVTLLQGLENAGFTVNQELAEFYKGLGYSRLVQNSWGQFAIGYTKIEAPVSAYSGELLENAKAFSDTALIVVSRIGGEGSDMPLDMADNGGEAGEHYLELSADERDMVELVTGMGFARVIVLVNTSNAMELGFLEDDGIDAAVWIGGPGANGMNAVGKVLSGVVNPSGRLVDTYAYDVTTAPAYWNTGDFTYTNSTHQVLDPFFGAMTDTMEHFVDYAEGIYVGYRYYETRWIDNETGLCDEDAYHAAVQYPFGYGLSYTTFAQEITGFREENGVISLDVTVTNTGNVPGKDVVQLYYTAPYTPGGIEKSHVVLCAFGKTKLLAASESDTLTLSFAAEDMASYDYLVNRCYVLDAGTYRIKLMNNAHDLIDSRDYAVSDTVVYGPDNARSTDLISAINLFDDMSFGENLTYVSRADWEGTLPVARTPDRDAPEAVLYATTHLDVEPDNSADDIVIQNHGLKLADMAGLSPDDPQWERLLEQLSVEDMRRLIGFGGWQTLALDSVGKPHAVDIDGPAGLNALINEQAYEGVQYTSGVVLASTWNVELIEKMGEAFGAEANVWKVSGLYAPGMNIHRSPFSGRNFEYYSEDPFLSGKVAAAEIAAIQSKGVYCYMKHLALNDQETNRYGLCVWANEQAAREIYLKPFEMAVKEGGVMGAMSAFDRLGAVWCGANRALCTTVMRDEWGFRGTIITDYCGNYFMNADQAIRAGNDLMLSSTGFQPSDTSNAGKQAMRTASRHILYTTLNSNAMEFNYHGPQETWRYALYGLDALVALAEIFMIVRYLKKRREFSGVEK